MNTPIALICGPAGSGKDTLANAVAKHAKGVCIAQADPMKRLARDVFQFTTEQLWGPSEARNAPDPRYADFWCYEEAERRLTQVRWDWICDVLPNLSDEEKGYAKGKLTSWFNQTRRTRGLSNEPLTARYVLQTLGTEWGRSFSASMWNDYALRMANALLEGGAYDREIGLINGPGAPLVLITDGRFRNEVLGVKRAGGAAIQVVGPKSDNAAVEAAGVKGHKSETELATIPDSFYSTIVFNDKKHGLEALDLLAQNLAQELLYGPHALGRHFVTGNFIPYKEENQIQQLYNPFDTPNVE